MASEMLKLTDSEENEYVLSQINRNYSRGTYLSGTVSRAISGRLNIRKRALKTTHTITWSMLSYDEAPDGGIGYSSLKSLVDSGEVYELTVLLYAPSAEEETFNVMFDPESLSLNQVAGYNRRFWNVSVTLLEV